jgi:nitrite reductase/ring-hydroxylating ferredoxin subunit
VAAPAAVYSRTIHTRGEERDAQMTEFVKVADAGDIPPGRIKLVDVHGERVAVANVDGRFHAFSDECTHDGGPLSDGDLDGAIVTCPWHFSRFDVRTGEIVESPAEEVIAVYETKVEDGSVYVGPLKTVAA